MKNIPTEIKLKAFFYYFTFIFIILFTLFSRAKYMHILNFIKANALCYESYIKLDILFASFKAK